LRPLSALLRQSAFIDQVSAQQTSGIAVGDAGFETPNVGTGASAYEYQPNGTPWTFSASAGVAGNGSGFTVDNPNAPDGTQVGFLQGDASSISQSFNFAAGAYTINFLAAQRANYQPAGDQTVQVLLDGSVAQATVLRSGEKAIERSEL